MIAARQIFLGRGGAKLPYDAEVEYLESTGTQWIDTGIIPTIDTICDIDCMSITFVVWGGIIGSCTSDNSADSYLIRQNGAVSIKGYSATVAGILNANKILVDDGVKASCHLSKDTFEVNGTIQTLGATAFSVNPSLPMFMFAVNLGGSPWRYRLFKGRVFSCKIYNGNILVRDFMPVRKGTVGYMYDRVSGKLFGNAGMGDFVLGPDVVTVEWLETTGRQYIDTGVTCGSTDTTVFEFDQSYSALQSGRFIWGSNYGANQGKDADNYYICGVNRSDVIMQAGVIYHCKTQVAPDNAIKAYINGTLFRDNTGSSPYTNPFYIFQLGGYGGGDGKPSYLRIHHLTVSINNALVRSFRPVRVGTDATSWEGAMMDTLTRRIYRNQGTGAFTYGNDK